MNGVYHTAYFFSDSHLHIHLNDQERLKRTRMQALFEKVKLENAMLCIVGDLFDFWFEYKYAVLRNHFDILHQLRTLVESGIQVHYVAGNHDLWLNSFFEQDIGVHVYSDFFSAQVGSLKVYAKHGDGLLKNDHSYRRLKNVLKNRHSISLYRLLHPDWGIPLAHFFSKKSRDYNNTKTFDGDADFIEFAQSVINEGFDYVIMGHTHIPIFQQLRGGTYINLGNWIKDFSYARMNSDGAKLLYWTDGK